MPDRKMDGYTDTLWTYRSAWKLMRICDINIHILTKYIHTYARQMDGWTNTLLIYRSAWMLEANGDL